MEHSELQAIALSKPKVQAAYDKLNSEFELLRQMLKVQKADIMKTHPDVVLTRTNTMSIDQLTQEALSLSNEARLQLVEELLISLEASVDPSIQSEWIAEAQSRWENIQNGSVQTIPGDEALLLI